MSLEDAPADIEKKLQKAFCPPEAEGNPVLEMYRYLVFEWLNGKPLTVHRPEKFGGNVDFATYDDLAAAYTGGKLHAGDLKAEAARRIIELTEPVRAHFKAHPATLEALHAATKGP